MHTSRRRRVGVIVTVLFGFVVVACVVHPFVIGASARRAVLAGFGSSLHSSPSRGIAANVSAMPRDERAHDEFWISGRAAGLYPGVVESLTLSVANPNRFAITVTSITTTVGDASSRCRAANVVVSSFAGARQVGPRSTGTVNVSVTMIRGAPNSCEGAVFPFRYTGRAWER